MVRRFMGGVLALTGVLGVAAGVLGSDKVKLYGKTGERWLGEQVEKIETLGVKLELLKTKVTDLDQEVARLERGVVQKKVEVETLGARIQEEEGAVARQKKTLERAASLLDEGLVRYEINGRFYSRDDLERDAQARLDACRDAERSIEQEKRVLQIRERTLDLARQHLDRARTRRVELSRELKTIDARIAQFRAKKQLAEALEQPDSSREVQSELAKVEKMAKELEDKLAVEERVVDERLAKTEASPGAIDFEQKEPAERAETAKAIRQFLAGPQQAPAPAPSATPREARPATAELH